MKEPVEQGMWGVFEVFVDTIIICSFTALVILCTGVWTTGDPGSVLSINAFGTLGITGRVIASIGLILFAGSSVFALATMATLVCEDMFGKFVAYAFRVVVLAAVVLGGTVGVDIAISWADVSNMLLILFNVTGMLCLSKTIVGHSCFTPCRSELLPPIVAGAS